MSYWHKHSLRLLKHELKRGELTIILLAIVLAVSAVFALSGFSSRVKQALTAESSTFIAADRVLDTGSVIDPAVLAKASSFKLVQAQQIQMSSMVFTDEQMALAALSAVSPEYPLRGELLVSPTLDVSQAVAANSPKSGEAWLEAKGLRQLGIKVGSSIEVGVMRFKVTGVITQIPDASFSVFSSGPVVFINTLDAQKTELIQPGSRLSYKYLFAGDSDNIAAFEQWFKPQISDNQRWYDIKSQNSPLARALTKADKYLSLASMLGIVLASVAVAVASRRYSQRHQPVVAVFKAMGASKRYVAKLYCLHWSLLSVLSISLGLIVGYLILNLGLYAMRDYLDTSNTGNMAYPFIVAVVTGIICAFAFAITPLKELVHTSPMTLLRGRDNGKDASLLSRLVSPLPALIAIFTLLYLFSQDAVLSASLLIGGVLVAMVLLVIGRLFMLAGRSAGSKAGKSWHLALANLKRRANENAVQLISFTIAIQLLLIIVVMKNGLIDDWQQQLPDNSANRFLVNVTASQVEQVNHFVDTLNIESSGLFPVVRGRLTKINNDQVTKRVSKEETKSADNGRRGVGRELNMTWRDALPYENSLLAGDWWQPDDTRALVSIESTLAEKLDVTVGDNLTFQLGSEEVEVIVSSVRKVNWQTLQPNFYMIFNQHVLADFPATYISSLYVPDDATEALQDFLTQYPTITLIDVDAIITQLRSVIGQVSIAIEFILVLVVLAGSLVLVAQVQASMEERERELAILRTLGASGRLLRNSVLFEFVALGALAGLMASIAMELGVYILQSRIFDMPGAFHFQYWLLGIGAGASFVGLIGLLSCWRLLNMSSVTLIRRTM
ncbi:FtsX-like permease family protein [Moritella sp. 24]|uniref:ABC transporter permease n=1 Tax=Moritella sp. 24 TaxID=2746230 RepID=UPI001BAB0AE7|nr:FtsX-like permease family protein [Moritella sp. 24]QUM75711.1 FtsX-like permease family protein [Moritella sp. 24]